MQQDADGAANRRTVLQGVSRCCSKDDVASLKEFLSSIGGPEVLSSHLRAHFALETDFIRGPLYVASASNAFNCMQYLLVELKLDPNAHEANRPLDTPLFALLGCAPDSERSVRLLLDHRADLNCATPQWTSFQVAILISSDAVFEMMLTPKYGARIDYCHPLTKANAFHIAAAPRKHERFTRLLKLLGHAQSLVGSNSLTSETLKSALNSLDVKRKRPLDYALDHAARMQLLFGRSKPEMVTLSCGVIANLCQSGADPFAVNVLHKETILVGACEDHTGAVLAALVSTSEHYQRIQDDYQYLHRAVSKGRNDAVDFLVKVVKCSPSLADPNRDGKNALHLAAARGEVSILATLVDAILEEDTSILDSCDLTGSTALHYAAIADSPECVEYLLEARADHLIRNTERELAEEVATSAKVRSLFRQYQHEKKLARVEESVIKTKENVEWLWLQQAGGQLSIKHTQATCRLIVSVDGQESRRSGTAFLLTHRNSALLITSRHVVIGEFEEEKEVTPLLIAEAQAKITRIDVIDCNGATFQAPAKDLHIHPIWDLAAIRCSIPLHSHFSLYLGNLPQLGQTLQVLGYPLDYDGKLAFFSTCTMGGIRNRGTAQLPVLHLLLSGGGVNQGNSGGPVIMLNKGHTEAWLVGVISHAPVRYSNALLKKLKVQPEESTARTCHQLFEQTKYVGITEAVSATEVEKFLGTIGS